MKDSVFIVWDMHADSWSGARSMVSIHKTLEGADASIPDNVRNLKHPGFGEYVLNYTYFAVELHELEN